LSIINVTIKVKIIIIIIIIHINKYDELASTHIFYPVARNRRYLESLGC